MYELARRRSSSGALPRLCMMVCIQPALLNAPVRVVHLIRQNAMRSLPALTNGNLTLARRVLCVAVVCLTAYLLLSNVLVLSTTSRPHSTNAHSGAVAFRPAFPNEPAVNLSSLSVRTRQPAAAIEAHVINNAAAAADMVAYDGFDGGQKQGQGPRLAPPKAAPDANAHAENPAIRSVKSSERSGGDEHNISELINQTAVAAVEDDGGNGTAAVGNGTQLKWLSDEQPSQPLPLCPVLSPHTKGRMPQAVLLISNLKEQSVISSYPELLPGGHWKPANCLARHKIAVIIPFRDRQSHLTRLIEFLIPLLQRQLIDFRFIVTEQYGHDLFNKGRIMNAAFTLAEKLGVDCVVFHDVDMFPQDDRCPYTCPALGKPRHIGAFVNSLGYELWYENLVGGVLALRMADYRRVNGYSNLYWAWGGEDDDMGKRILGLKMTIERPDKTVSGFTMLKHVKRQRTAVKSIYSLLDNAETRMASDGLAQGLWRILKVSKTPLYYHIYVDVGEPPDEWKAQQ